jgi:hypothetical protein
VVDGTRIPVRGIYLLLVAFALFIGPVMVILLARRNRRIWLFWIAPTVSLATCAIIFVHALLSEGTRPTIRTDSIVVLDQESRLALSLATTGVYCPMTPSGGLSFGSETEVTPLLDMQASGRRTIDWSARQHLDSGWVLSRVPAAFVTRSVGTRHERLECAATDDGGIRIVNGLGAPIRHVRLADAQGKMHEVAGVPAGGSAALRDMPTTGKTAATTDLAQFAATTFFSTNRRISFTNAVQVANLPIPPPGHYVAVLDGAPFADNALPVAAHRTETTIVCGRLAPASK